MLKSICNERFVEVVVFGQVPVKRLGTVFLNGIDLNLLVHDHQPNVNVGAPIVEYQVGF